MLTGAIFLLSLPGCGLEDGEGVSSELTDTREEVKLMEGKVDLLTAYIEGEGQLKTIQEMEAVSINLLLKDKG